MKEIITALQSTPLPTLLVVGGLAFLFLAVVGQVGGQLQVPASRQRWAGLIGSILLILGVVLYVIPGPVSDTIADWHCNNDSQFVCIWA